MSAAVNTIYSTDGANAFDIPTYIEYVEQLRKVVDSPSPSRQRLVKVPCIGMMTSAEVTHAQKFGWEVYR